MMSEIYWPCAQCGEGISEFEDIYLEEDNAHYCQDCAKDAGLYKCHWCGRVYDVTENNNTCPECGRRPE